MTPGRVLVVGDANPDLVLSGDTVPRFGQVEQLLDSADLVLGGSAAIVACGLARLGVPTTLAAVVGGDRFGDFVVDQLTERGVGVDALCVDGDAPTGLTVLLLRPGDRGILTFPGTIPTLTATDVRAAVERVRPAHVHFASYYLQPHLAAELPELLKELRAAGIRSSLDTNWDPAETWHGMSEVLPLVDVFLPNEEELVAIGRAIDPAREGALEFDDAGRALAATGARVVAKIGRVGAVSYDADRITRVPSLPVDVVDTAGAGDSFDAGYLAALLHGVDSETDRLSWASAAGSLSVTGRGGIGAQATLDDLERVGVASASR